MEKIPELDDIIQAHHRIKNFIHRTPVLKSESINRLTGANIYFKCENLQKVGAFKFRGATNSVLSLSESEKKFGVATHSSGNHAAALALAAKIQGIPSYIVMPETAPEIKKKAVAGYGAKITFCKPTQQEREKTLISIVQETRASFIHPYDNYKVIEGQATAAKELIEDYGDFDIIMTPVGGGGILSGSSLIAKYLNHNTEIIGAEPLGADDAYRSFRDNIIYPSTNPKTIADGLLTSLSLKTFEIIKAYVSRIITVDEYEIISAMRLIWERMKIIIEPSSAVPLGAILANKDYFEGKKVGIIISGGNVDLEKLPWIK